MTHNKLDSLNFITYRNAMGLNYFDAILYINLDQRVDRKTHILDQLMKLDVLEKKIHRIPGIYNSANGHRGCVQAHIAAIDFAIKEDLNNVLILEDDCLFVQNKQSINHSISFFFDKITQWDVFFLGTHVVKYQDKKYPQIKRVLKSYLAHAYAINNHYFSKLKQCYLSSLQKLQNESILFSQKSNSPLDQHWQTFQAKDNWYICNILAVQNEGYSDIENKSMARDVKIL